MKCGELRVIKADNVLWTKNKGAGWTRHADLSSGSVVVIIDQRDRTWVRVLSSQGIGYMGVDVLYKV